MHCLLIWLGLVRCDTPIPSLVRYELSVKGDMWELSFIWSSWPGLIQVRLTRNRLNTWPPWCIVYLSGWVWLAVVHKNYIKLCTYVILTSNFLIWWIKCCYEWMECINGCIRWRFELWNGMNWCKNKKIEIFC